jgi:hypothetical protein
MARCTFIPRTYRQADSSLAVVWVTTQAANAALASYLKRDFVARSTEKEHESDASWSRTAAIWLMARRYASSVAGSRHRAMPE